MQMNALKSLVLIGAGAAAVWIASNPKENVARMKSAAAGMKEMVTPSQGTEIVPVPQSWSPDSYDIDNNEMVSEGSVYGVNYYNEKIQ
jgi:hypothetical protein